MSKVERLRSQIRSLLAESLPVGRGRRELEGWLDEILDKHGLRELFYDYLVTTHEVTDVSDLGDKDLQRAARFAQRLARMADAGTPPSRRLARGGRPDRQPREGNE